MEISDENLSADSSPDTFARTDSMVEAFMMSSLRPIPFWKEECTYQVSLGPLKQGKDSMGFARQATAAVILITLTLWVQGAGMALVIHLVRARFARGIKGLNVWRSAVLVIRFTAVLIVLHILQVLLWAGFYRWHCLPTWESSFYFSATSYSTVGYGDVILPQAWRTLGPIESVIGVIMCGMSVSGLFAIAIRLIGSETREPSIAETRFASAQVQELRQPIAK